jgi:hypothetical protein
MDKNKIITDLTTICRFCLKHVDSEKVEIDEVLRKQFNNITNIEVSGFSNRFLIIFFNLIV